MKMDNIQPNDNEPAKLVIELPGAEKEEDIRKCYDTFLATQEAEYLDRAIFMTQELVTSGVTNELLESSQVILTGLQRIRYGVVAVTQDEVPINVEIKNYHNSTEHQSISLTIELPGAENEDIIQESYSAFLDTGEIEYLESTICLVEDLVSTSPSDQLLQSSQLLLADLCKVRGNLTADTHDITDHNMNDSQDRLETRGSQQNRTSRIFRFWEAMELSNRLYHTFEATDDVHYLDEAIGQTREMEGLAPSHEMLVATKSILETLEGNRARWAQRAILREANISKDGGSGSIPDSILHENSLFQEAYELSKSVLTMYEATRDIEYLGIAIGQVEEMERLATSEEVSQCTHWYLDHLRGIRDRMTLESGPHMANGSQEAMGENGATISRLLGAPGSLGRLPSGKEQLATIEDLEEAISKAIEGVAATTTDDVSHTNFLNTAARLHVERYDRLGIPEDLAQAIKYMEEMVVAPHPNERGRVSAYLNLSGLLRRRHYRLGVYEDLDQAIKYVRDAAAVAPFDQAIQQATYPHLAVLLWGRFRQLGDLEDLEEAIKCARDTIASTTVENPFHGVTRHHLAAMLFERSKRLGNIVDLEQSIEHSRYNMKKGFSDDPNCIPYHSNLAHMLNERFERLGNIADLELAVSYAEDAAAAAPTNPVTRGIKYSTASVILTSKYKHQGKLEDLERAIKYSNDAITAKPSHSPTEAIEYHNLGCLLERRYERLGRIEDLQQCISYVRDAIEATPLNDPMIAIMYHSIARALQDRYERLDQLEDLEEAIKYAREGLAAMPSKHSDRVGHYNNLANMFFLRHKRLGIFEDLENAIKHAKDAITAAPPGYPNRTWAVFTLTKMLLCRYELSGSQVDLEQAASCIQEAISAIPFNNPTRAKYLCLQGEVAELNNGGSIQGFQLALHSFQEGWYSQASPPYNRIKAAFSAAYLLIPKKRWQEAASLLEGAVKMLPKLSSRSFGRVDQERHFSSITGLVPIAVSIALQAGEEATHCLRLLELGRGIIMSFVIDGRSDLSELQLNHPNIAQKFIHLSSTIDSPVTHIERSDKELMHQEPQQQQRYQAAQKLEETLAHIRGLVGFEGFQLPPHSHQLIALASEGPIVIFNSTRYRSDAIIITSSFIKSLPLQKLRYDSVAVRIARIPELVHGKRKSYRWRNEAMKDLLLWLWDVAVEPVLEELAATLESFKSGAPGTYQSLPRVWWIGVGSLAMVPFHAAGDHSPRSTRNTISRVVSSYTPTIKALSYARERKLGLLSNPDSRLLLVNMPTTPGHKALRNATDEVEAIVDIVKGRTATTRLDHPCAARVLEQLPECHAVHFSCHGVSNGQSPSQSHLLLRKPDGSSVDELTVEAVANTNIKNAQIAYLSACSTAQNASEPLADESIHIASGFQLAGFSHVLATQWISNDAACRQVSGDFYRSLFSEKPSGGKSDEGHEKVSAAFHYAVKKLRNENLSQPILWAPFIHTGA